MNVAVFGIGYVGIVTAAGLAELGHRVTALDSDPVLVERLRKGEIPIFEPGLEERVAKGRASGAIVVSDDVEAAVHTADIIFVCVGTPSRDDGRPDLSQVESVARTIAETACGSTTPKLVVEKSTVPV